jgi:RimJ/RimL family protein N-acetyltransferase
MTSIPSQVNQLLVAKDWAGLERHFAVREPDSAEEFQARALLALSRSVDIPWPRVIADLRRACDLQPADGLLRANLAQALLDSGQADEAYREARVALQLAPQAYAPLEKLALAAAANRRWPEAHQLLLRAARVLEGKRPLPDGAAQLLMRLQSQWWAPIQSAGLTLRQPQAGDAAFLARTFDDAAFMRRFHRFQRGGPGAVRQFIDIAQQPPDQSRRLDWIVVDRREQAIGLVALVDIDRPNQRGELLVGFAGAPPAMAALQASVAAIHFAFARFGLQKLVSYVYADNPEAQANTLHLGFTQEGLLRSHIACEGGRQDLFANALLRGDWEASSFLRRLTARWKIGAA